MRGKVLFNVLICLVTGITPAYAGKSRALYAEAKNYKDHPRLCGEKLSSRVLQLFRQGSPPPMRGKGAGDTTIFQCCRITPAYAGKSRSAVETNRRCRDHPRLCGEKSPLWYNNRRGEGSPPPMRGKDPAYV